MTTEPRTEAQAMTTPGLSAKARIRGAWFAAFDRPLPELRAEVDQLFAAIETEASRLALEDVAERVDKELGRVEREYAKQGDLALAEAQLTAVLALLSTKEEGS